MDAEETNVLRLHRNAEQQAFEGRPVRARRAAAGFSTEVPAVRANAEVSMRPTRRYRGQHVAQGVAHRSLQFGGERVHGADQSFERIARNRFFAFVRQSESNAPPVRLGSLTGQVPTRLKPLMACDAVPRVVA